MAQRLDDSWYLCFVAASYYLEWEASFWDDPVWYEQQQQQQEEQELDTYKEEERPQLQSLIDDDDEEEEDEMLFLFRRSQPEEKEEEVMTLSSYKGLTKFKCVSFDLKPTYHEVLPLSEYTAEEFDSAFYGRMEVDLMQAAALDPDNERNSDCHGGFRGLEQYAAAGSTRLELNRVQVVAAVLREQKRQAHWKRKNDVLIAQAASRISQECQELACIQGFNDEMEAHGVNTATDVVALPKPGVLEGLQLQLTAIREMAFLERLGKRIVK